MVGASPWKAGAGAWKVIKGSEKYFTGGAMVLADNGLAPCSVLEDGRI